MFDIFLCSCSIELFSVIEKSTGKLIQGSLQPTIVTHQVRVVIECYKVMLFEIAVLY